MLAAEEPDWLVKEAADAGRSVKTLPDERAGGISGEIRKLLIRRGGVGGVNDFGKQWAK